MKSGVEARQDLLDHAQEVRRIGEQIAQMVRWHEAKARDLKAMARKEAAAAQKKKAMAREHETMARLLRTLGDEQRLTADGLERTEVHLRRRPPVRRASRTSAPLTPKLADDIRFYAAHNPHVSYMDLGARFNVSTGRISEVLAGKRR